jgi:hypothetical protein
MSVSETLHTNTKKHMPSNKFKQTQIILKNEMKNGKQGTFVFVTHILRNSDILNMIFEKLHAKNLFVCSLVCRGFLEQIDCNPDYFGKFLRWWSIYDATYSEECIVKYNLTMDQYEHWQTINLKGIHNWLSNTNITIGAKVNMRMNLQLALTNVELYGKDHHVNDLRKRGFASIDVLEWEIVHVHKTGLQADFCKGRKGNVQMQALSYSHLNSKVKLRVSKAIVVTFKNVPIPDHQLSIRVLTVLKCLRICTHCCNASAKWKSVDSVTSEHRALCNVCLNELYVEDKNLKSKYKIFVTPSELDYFFFFDRNKRMYTKFYLKSDLTQALGLQHFAQILHHRCIEQRNKRKNQRKVAMFDFNNHWFT